jgi:hypothetical protein
MQPNKIRHRLGRSFTKWAEDRNHNPNTVVWVIRTWHNKATNARGHLPSALSAQILLDLSEDCQMDVSPSVKLLKDAAAEHQSAA